MLVPIASGSGVELVDGLVADLLRLGRSVLKRLRHVVWALSVDNAGRAAGATAVRIRPGRTRSDPDRDACGRI